jgi:Fur family ferric uptake transcriptional regulator
VVAKRNTWQREAVREALGRSEGFVSAQSLHGQLRETGSPIGLATVYRALADLATDGAADSLQQEGESLYRACTPGTHHHHLICRTCGTTVEIEADAVETWAAPPGLCARCALGFRRRRGPQLTRVGRVA